MARYQASSKGSSDSKIQNAFHEVYNKVPANVKATGKTGSAKRKMLTAIALNKARDMGARVPGPGN